MKAKEDAHEILLGNMSIATDKYVREMPHLREWIIDSMKEYANQRVIEELEELIDGLDEFELHSDFPYLINKRIKELKQ